MISRTDIIATLVFAAICFGAGYWTKGSLVARAEVKDARVQAGTDANAAQSYDELIADKVGTDGRVARDVSRINARRQEAKRREPTYREYLDSPIPAQSRELYRAAEAIDYGRFAGPDPGSDGAERGDDEASE